MWEHARDIATKGYDTYGKRGRTVTYQGTELLVGWALDAVWTVVGIAWITRSGVTDEVFCESCGKWATPWQTVHLLPPGDTAPLRQAKEGDFAGALGFPLDPSKAALPRLLLTVHRCEGCIGLHAWQLSEVKETSSRGGRSVSTSTISPFYVLSPDELARWQNYP